MPNHLLRRLPTVLGALALALPLTAHAQAAGGNWEVGASLSTSETYDNNVFLLPATKKDNVAAPRSAEVRSGRYADMASASDMITSIEAALKLQGRGLGGRTLTVVPTLGYDVYARNGARNGAQLGLSATQRLGKGSTLRLRGTMTPRTFFKNYMADAIDRDGSGSITSDERVYVRDRQGETTLGAEYTRRIDKATAASPFGAELQLGGGWYSRSNDAPFASRDLSGPTFGASARLDLTSSTRLDVTYDLAALSASRTTNVILLDENQFNQDFNGNGTRTDVDARAVQMVDRSRLEQELGLSLQSELSDRIEGELSVEHRMRNYGSTQPYDIANNGRRDARNEVAGDVHYRIAGAVRLRVTASYASQSLNRAGPAATAGDVADYSRLRGAVAVVLRY